MNPKRLTEKVGTNCRCRGVSDREVWQHGGSVGDGGKEEKQFSLRQKERSGLGNIGR